MEINMITIKQFMVILFVFILGDSILVLPSAVIGYAKGDAWISGILSVIFGLGIMFLYYKLGMINKGQTLIESCEFILGKWLGKGIAFVFILYAFLSVALLFRELSDFLSTQYLEDTPPEIIMALFAITVTLASRYGLKIIGRTAEIFLPWIVTMIFFSIIMLFGKMDFMKLFPMLERGWKPVIQGAVPFISFPYLEAVLLLAIFPFVKDQKIKYKNLFWPALLGGLVLVILTFLALVILGYDAAATSMYPTLKLAQKIKIGTFVQRLDVLVATFWLFTIFFKTVFYFNAGMIGLGQLFKVKQYQYLGFPLVWVCVAAALLVAEDTVSLNVVLMKIWPFFDLTLGFFLPITLLITALIKRRKSNNYQIRR